MDKPTVAISTRNHITLVNMIGLCLCLRIITWPLTGPRFSKPWRRATSWASSWPRDFLNRTKNEFVKTSRDAAAAISTVAAKHCSHMIAMWPLAADWSRTFTDVTIYRPRNHACVKLPNPQVFSQIMKGLMSIVGGRNNLYLHSCQSWPYLTKSY